MKGQKDLRTKKSGGGCVNKIENQGENWYKMLQNGQMTDLWKIRPTLGQIIFGTKCDRDKLIFSAEKKVNKIALGIKKGTQWDRKM